MTVAALVDHLRATTGVRHKLDLRPLADALRPAMRSDIPVGDDCAAIPDGDGYLLFAIEGLLASFVEKEPWFAGYCAVMVNLSDVAAMGGRPTAVVDAVWARSDSHAGQVWEGMAAAAAKYGVPVVGGHTNTRNAGGDYVAAAVLGRAKSLLTSFDARPGDRLIAAIDLRGEWFGPYPYWNASTTASADRLRGDTNVLPLIAEAGLCRAAKDISMAGLVGTAVMLAECSGVGFTLDVDAVPRPVGAPVEKWLTAFPSYGYLLAVAPEHAADVSARFGEREIAAAVIGECTADRRCTLVDAGGASAVFWDLAREPFMGLAPTPVGRR